MGTKALGRSGHVREELEGLWSWKRVSWGRNRVPQVAEAGCVEPSGFQCEPEQRRVMVSSSHKRLVVSGWDQVLGGGGGRSPSTETQAAGLGAGPEQVGAVHTSGECFCSPREHAGRGGRMEV